MSISLPFKPALLSGAVSLFAISAALPALSQELIDIGEVVVTPNRTPTEKSKVGSTVNTIDEETIEAQSLPAVTDYLTLLPGVSASSAGGIGTEGSLSVRGLPRRYVKTLYNGIDISDPTSTQVQTSYQYLLGANIDHIEVLKGSQSTLYGSEAIAGVISISTLGGVDLGVRHHVHAEGGSYGTVRGGYGLEAANETSALALNIAGFRTDGISAAAAGTERDGYENITADFNAEHRFSENFSVFASGLYIDAEAEFDEDWSIDQLNGAIIPPQDNPFNRNSSEQLAGRVGFNLDLLDGRAKNTFSVQGFTLNRGISSVSSFGPYNAEFVGTRLKADYQGSFEVNDWLVLQYGADYERERSEYSDDVGSLPTDDSASIAGAWMQANVQPVENLFITAGLRHDEHDAFDGATTYRLSGAYVLPEYGTRFHSSFGTGFRAPSLFELYAAFGTGDPDLQPETSTSFDIGVEQEFLDGSLIGDITYFHINTDDLIECVPFDPNSPFICQYSQTEGTTRQQGAEFSLAYAATDWLDIGLGYTFTDAEDPNGNRSIRVPKHTVGVTAVARPAEKWTISASARVAIDAVDRVRVGSQRVEGEFCDTDGNCFPTVSYNPIFGLRALDDYVLVNAKVAYKPTDDTELYLRVENLLDQDYQTVRGFGTPGLSAYAGFKAVF